MLKPATKAPMKKTKAKAIQPHALVAVNLEDFSPALASNQVKALPTQPRALAVMDLEDASEAEQVTQTFSRDELGKMTEWEPDDDSE
jgi:hypothetical protein